SGNGVHSAGFYYYDNKFASGNGAGADFTSFYFLEGGQPSAPSSTPCDDPSSDNYLFNNVLIDQTTDGNGIGDGVMSVSTGNNHIYNNTLIGSGHSHGLLSQVFAHGTIDMQNNILTSADQLITSGGTWAAFTSSSPDYNLYADNGMDGNA